MRKFDDTRIEAARKELEERGGYIVPMPLGLGDDGCFYFIGGGFGTGLWIGRKRVTVNSVIRSAATLKLL